MNNKIGAYCNQQSIVITLKSLVLAVSINQFASADTVDADWPCIQGYVAMVEMAVLWPEVIPEADKGQWKNDDRIAPLARKLGALREYTDEDRTMVEQFIESTPDADKASVLNRLAEGTLAVANDRRSLYMKGIRKYTRQQTSISIQIQDGLNKLYELDEAGADLTEEQMLQRKELYETMEWHQRIFDQREHSMVALCDQPVKVELTLSDVLRDLAQYLP